MLKLFFKIFIILILLLNYIICFAQKQDRIWLFSDRAGIDFNDLANPIAITSNITDPCLTSFTSIADTSGQLLFYCAGVELTFTAMRVFDKNGNLMQNGDSLQGYPWVNQGCMIIPFPNHNNLYYLFVCNIAGSSGNIVYYNIIDISLNNGLGGVVSKNNLLLFDNVNEKINATKHANGRDWWLILQSTNIDSLFHKFLITPTGISGPFEQKIGTGDNPNKFHGQMVFSKDGSKLGVVGGNSSVDIFDFDRCTGELFNPKTIGENIFTSQNYYLGCSFSYDGNVFYTSSVWYEYKNIYQFNLSAVDIRASKQLIFSYPDTGALQGIQMGLHLLAPDGKIYISKGTNFGGTNWDTYFTHHMDVIANPDNVGTSCNYLPSSFDLGIGKTATGLPTMLNYNLGPVVGSICDSLSNGIKENPVVKNIINIYPNPFQSGINIRTTYPIKGKLYIKNNLGEVVVEDDYSSNQKIELGFLKDGIYFVSVRTTKEVFLGKVVKIK
jgi:hypothetical protein